MRSNRCVKCEGPMSEGFILAERSGLRAVSTWAEGPPRKTWFGLRLRGKPIEIKTMRCQRCGFLESYAPG
jgi:hypothetical protein